MIQQFAFRHGRLSWSGPAHGWEEAKRRFYRSGMLPEYKRRVAMDRFQTQSGKKDRRRRHHHWLVTVSYWDKDFFRRVYLDQVKARKFAARQRRSPVVKGANVRLLS